MVSADLTIMEITMSRFLCYSAVSTLIFLAVNVMWSAARNNHSRSTQFVNGGVWQKQNILHIFILLNQSWRPCFIIISFCEYWSPIYYLFGLMMFASLQVRMVVCLNPNADDYDESVVRGPKTIFVQLVQSQFYVLDFGTD